MRIETQRNDGRKKFIAVIGTRNAGKSTIIVSLTGCPNRSFRDTVTDDSNNESIYVIASSPQEERLERNGNDLESELRAFRNILNQLLQNDNCLGLVMAIQPIRKPTRRLSLEAIVQEVQRTNDLESYLFVLDPGRNEARPILDEVNRRLENIGSVAQGLDGRRFAFLNARDINQTSRLFL